MKLAFTTFACPRWPFDRILSAAAEYGYHGIEFRCDAGQRHGIEAIADRDERRRFTAALSSANLEPCCLATGLRLVRRESVAEVRARIDLAVDIGFPALRVFCGRPLEEMQLTGIITQCADHLSQAADLASQAGVQLWLETHDVISRAADCAAIVRAVNHPLVGINYDNLHPVRGGEPLAATFASLGTLVRHCHFHDGLVRSGRAQICPFGEGELPIEAMFAGLLDIGYDGYVSGEWFGDMYGLDPDTALAAYHRDMSDLAGRLGCRLG